jgi:hypothetical protein
VYSGDEAEVRQWRQTNLPRVLVMRQKGHTHEQCAQLNPRLHNRPPRYQNVGRAENRAPQRCVPPPTFPTALPLPEPFGLRLLTRLTPGSLPRPRRGQATPQRLHPLPPTTLPTAKIGHPTPATAAARASSAAVEVPRRPTQGRDRPRSPKRDTDRKDRTPTPPPSRGVNDANATPN